MPNTSTGSFELPDIGTLSYNGITFSALYHSNVAGRAVLDDAGRTVKNMEYTITVEGIVTLNDKLDLTIDREFADLRQQLEVCAGTLYYSGKGFGQPFIVNAPGTIAFTQAAGIKTGGNFRDIAWGPIPKVLDFTPLGGSRSANIRWQVVTNVCEQSPGNVLAGSNTPAPITQFNFASEVDYDADGFSKIRLNGVLEIALTRISVNNRVSQSTIDDFRIPFMAQIASGFDLTRFKVVNRSFKYSADRRTMHWSFDLDEMPWMSPPVGMLTANGSYSVEPAQTSKHLLGTNKWVCTLQGSYVVPNGEARRAAWFAFAMMWSVRMKYSQFGSFSPPTGSASSGVPVGPVSFLTVASVNTVLAGVGVLAEAAVGGVVGGIGVPAAGGVAAGGIAGGLPGAAGSSGNIQSAPPSTVFGTILSSVATAAAASAAGGLGVNTQTLGPAKSSKVQQQYQKAIPFHFSFEEGLYLDSKTIRFKAKWILFTTIDRLLIASGLWQKSGLEQGLTWAANIQGGQSWLRNNLEPRGDVIVDFGGGANLMGV